MRILLLLGVVTWYVASSNAALDTFNDVVHSINYETNRMVQAIAQTQSGNFIFSPISVKISLLMLLYGTRGVTHRELRRSLGIPNNSDIRFPAIRNFTKTYSQFSEVKLILANKIFIAKRYGVDRIYATTMKRYFEAELQDLQFADATGASETINDWCAKKTENRIKNIISSDILSSDTKLVLVNAIYFKGMWASNFTETLSLPFYLKNNEMVLVPMMRRKGSYRIGNLLDNNAMFVEIPYKSKDDTDGVNMYIIMPNNNLGIDYLIRHFHLITIDQLQNGNMNEIQLAIPEFKQESLLDLHRPLSKLGVKSIFTDDADFSKITSGDRLKVSKMYQKAFIEINKGGSEAAAVTATVVNSRFSDNDVQEFTVNQPFICLITTVHKVTLFSAIVKDPRENN